jgi:hypothetical protein
MHDRGQNALRVQALARAPITLGAFDKFQFVDVAREGSLAYLKALALESVLEQVLAFDGTFVEQVEDRFVARRFRHE